MEQKLSMPNFKHGMNILIKPESLDLDSIKIEKNNENLKKYKKFFSEEFVKNQTLVDEFNKNHGKINYIQVKNRKTLEKEIKNSNDFPSIDNIYIHAGKNSKLKLIIYKLEGKTYHGEDLRIIAEEGSNVEILIIQKLNKNVTNFQKKTSYLCKNSSLEIVELCMGSNFTRSESIYFLKGDGSKINHNTFFISNKDQKYDLYTEAIHEGKKSESKLITKGVLNGSSRVLSRGLIKIKKNAPGSIGYKKQDSLLLSKKAEADAIPRLEIENSEVKCNHGSSIGSIDQEKLFYLMSRGLSMKEAKKKIIEGYFNPIIRTLNIKTRNYIQNIIEMELEKNEIG